MRELKHTALGYWRFPQDPGGMMELGVLTHREAASYSKNRICELHVFFWQLQREIDLTEGRNKDYLHSGANDV